MDIHGILFVEFKKYLNAKFGGDTWANMRRNIKLDCDTFKSPQRYPYEDLLKIVQATCQITGLSQEFIFEDFGEYIGLKFVDMFWYVVNAKWKTLDTLEHSLEIVSIIAKSGKYNFHMKCERTSASEVVVVCKFLPEVHLMLKGSIKGLSRYHQEQIKIASRSMDGDAWEFTVTLVSEMSQEFIEKQSQILDQLIESVDNSTEEISASQLEYDSDLVTAYDPASKVTTIVTPKTSTYFPGYEIVKEIGAGGMGIVYKAKQHSLDRFVAIKMIAPSLSSDEIFVKRLQTEAKVMAQLQHANIVSAIDFGFQEDSYYIVMEYVEGRSLQQHIKENGPLSEKKVLKLALAIANALECLDENQLVHRDINPSNILIDKNNIPKLTDLGLVKSSEFEDELGTSSDMWVGTPQYMSAEQIQSEQDLDIRSDIYSLGATLYYAITGKHRFRAASSVAVVYYQMLLEPPLLEEDMNVFPPHLGDILYKMLEHKPENRYQNPEELIVDLKLALSGSSRRVKKLRETKKSKRNNVKRLSKIHCVRGNEFFHQRDIEAAIDCYNKALEIDPELAVAYHNRGKAHHHCNEMMDAIVDYSEAIHCNPCLAKAYKNRAVAFLQTKNYQTAISDFRKYLELKPNALDIHKIKKYIRQCSKALSRHSKRNSVEYESQH
ncbi:protein kinase domain-containing protein [Candidatus Uabimicrobium amorphum]|uniref:Protein kinase n=1 Tax=Uabimicrobium amorphum TaxID=2596890 RepID=A0A5S9F2K5_UABAM|nr:protein kinase [Candidatus Uabimicrobium amorphum]BBM83765.1 protein kinase [Candidatus Uabimicrobium amorphum]